MAFLSFTMNSSSLSLFFTFLLCASNLAFFDANSIQTFSRFPSSDNRSETDRLLLLALKSQLNDPLKTLASWDSSFNEYNAFVVIFLLIIRIYLNNNSLDAFYYILM
ncbi:hypothetical protein Droror1_Dr00021102 [Drosera rotundifolia]